MRNWIVAITAAFSALGIGGAAALIATAAASRPNEDITVFTFALIGFVFIAEIPILALIYRMRA